MARLLVALMFFSLLSSSSSASFFIEDPPPFLPCSELEELKGVPKYKYSNLGVTRLVVTDGCGVEKTLFVFVKECEDDETVRCCWIPKEFENAEVRML